MNKQSLQELRDKVAAGDLNSTELGTLFGSMALKGYWTNSIGLSSTGRKNVFLAYNGSLDAAVAFLEAVLPEWNYSAYTEKSKPAEVIVSNSKDRREYSEGFDLIPARALLLATFDALIARAE